MTLLFPQAFRKLALTKHPDKQPDNPNAAAEFGLIQRAYEVLLAPGPKAAWVSSPCAGSSSSLTAACMPTHIFRIAGGW